MCVYIKAHIYTGIGMYISMHIETCVGTYTLKHTSLTDTNVPYDCSDKNVLTLLALNDSRLVCEL